jgi:DNA-binding NarL/FixJ family response regulator
MIAPIAEVRHAPAGAPNSIADASSATSPEASPSTGPLPLVKPDRSLRPSAVKADMTATTELPLAMLWRELTRGTSFVLDGFFHADRCFLLVSRRAQPAAPLRGRRLEILEAVLEGQRQKNIALDRGLAPSTVALNSRLGLEALGVSSRPSRAHPLLMLAARAASLQLPALAKCSTLVTDHNAEVRVLSMARPDAALTKVLPSAELSVIGGLVEGACYREIARARGTSTRTIANQISAVFRRLHVSGRNELVQRLFVDGALGHSPAPSPSPPQRPSLPMKQSA